ENNRTAQFVIRHTRVTQVTRNQDKFASGPTTQIAIPAINRSALEGRFNYRTVLALFQLKTSRMREAEAPSFTVVRSYVRHPVRVFRYRVQMFLQFFETKDTVYRY